MDWAKAIDTHQVALARIVATLIAMLGLASEGAAAKLPKPLYRAVLRVLRPAEAAVRRLIVVAARGLKVELAPARPRPRPKRPAKPSTGSRLSSFPLFDPPHRIGHARLRRAGAKRAEPRIHFFDGHSYVSSSPPQPAPKPEDGHVGALRLSRRLAAVKHALEDLQRQAKRLARWQARLARMPNQPKSPIRPGPPPGCRVKPQQEIDWLLWECHLLATDALSPDTS